MFKIQIIDLDNNEVQVDTVTSVIMGAMLCNEKTDDKRACLQFMSFFNDDIVNTYYVAQSLEELSKNEIERCVNIVKERFIGAEEVV